LVEDDAVFPDQLMNFLYNDAAIAGLDTTESNQELTMPPNFLEEARFDFIREEDREFILAFSHELNRLGYDFGGKIGEGYCWGKYMLIYTRSGVKSKNVYARIYIREAGIVLRLYLNDLDRHRAFLENSPDHIKGVFTGPHGDCQHCHNERDGKCRFRKTYTLELKDYLQLFREFYPRGKN
jgi:hypothetical protein